MQTAENQYKYFQNLERTTKTGLIAYLFLLVFGFTISVAGVDNAFNFVTSMKRCEILFILLLTINLFQLFIRGINRINWLGDIHVWLDNKIFGFLFKSNEIILRELLILLDPKERVIIDTLGRSERTAVAQSIFSKLAEDQSIFEGLLKRGIFRSWIWYWIMIYGVTVFIFLTILSLSKTLLVPTIYTKAFFASVGIVAVAHLIFSLLMGYNLVFVTKRIIREITAIYQPEIVSLLRNHVNKSR